MTKWSRMRKRKERKREEEKSANFASEGNEIKQTESENVSDKIKHSQETQKLETPKTSKSNPILSLVPRYVYLVAIFALLSGVFFPLITTTADSSMIYTIGGTAILFVGLTGGILIFKAASMKNRVVFLTTGSVLIAISLALIFLMQEWWRLEFIRG